MNKLIVLLTFFCINLYAVSGYFNFEYSSSDKDWNFLPKNIEKFNFYENSKFKLLILDNDFGISYQKNNYYLNIERNSHPKSVATSTNSYQTDIHYFLSFDRFLSFSKIVTKADQQTVDCYTFYESITIGFCDDAKLTIINSKKKYSALENNKLLLIDGESLEYKIKYTQAVENTILNNYSIYFSVSENKFLWISPIEELTSGFISRLTYNEKTIGLLASEAISRFPQRNPYLFNKIGLTVDNVLAISNSTSFFYNIDLVHIRLKDYKVALDDVPNFNVKLKSGVSYTINNLVLSLSGTIYKNNLIGFKDITYNQKTEHHFKHKFASVDLELKYFF